MPEYPDWIPYKTSYYNEDWGFCLSHNELINLSEDIYEVKIDSKLSNGNLSYGEFLIVGKSKKEILFSTYFCHPSQCNDNLSGVAMLIFLGKYMENLQLYLGQEITF